MHRWRRIEAWLMMDDETNLTPSYPGGVEDREKPNDRGEGNTSGESDREDRRDDAINHGQRSSQPRRRRYLHYASHARTPRVRACDLDDDWSSVVSSKGYLGSAFWSVDRMPALHPLSPARGRFYKAPCSRC